MTQTQISEFREHLLFCEESVRQELRGENISDKQAQLKRARLDLARKVPRNLDFARTRGNINRERILLDLEKICVLKEIAIRIIAKVESQSDKYKYYPVKFVAEQRRDLLIKIEQPLILIEKLFKKLFYSSFNSRKRRTLIEKRIKNEKALAINVKKFDDWVHNQRLLNSNDCFITRGLELTYYRRPYNVRV